jgi:hypothetical protein
MKNKWWICLVAVIVVLVLAVFGIRIWFKSPGIHVWGDEIHINLTEKCFVFDGRTGELEDETTVTVKGGTSRSDKELFDGDLKVIGYQNFADGTITDLKAIEKREDDSYIITHMENCTHPEEDDNGIIKDVEHFCDYSYYYYIDPNDPTRLVVAIDSTSRYKTMYAVCAENEEAAQARYEEFISKLP